MKIGGIQKNSMIDYPGKLCCVLFLTGCNFTCPYCHNPELAKGEAPPTGKCDEAFVFDFLEKRKHFLDGVVISGGEPTLHGDLVHLCEKVKEKGYPVKLDTNGSRPEVLRELIHAGLVDYLAMDIKTDPMRYGDLIKNGTTVETVFSSIGIIMGSGLPYEFKTTCIRSLVDAEAVDNISRMIEGARLYALQQFHDERVLDPDLYHNEAQRYPLETLESFKALADRRVRSCIIRS